MPRPLPSDSVSEAARNVEDLVDSAFSVNPLVSLPFAEAAWRFLAFCEEYSIRESLDPPSSRYGVQARADFVINHAKWPLRWLHQQCASGGDIPRAYHTSRYQAAWDLSRLAAKYVSFESAYTYATIGVIGLDLVGSRLVPSPPLSDDAQYDAYDRLVDVGDQGEVASDVRRRMQALSDRVGAAVRTSGERFRYALSPRLMRMATEATAVPLGPGPALPSAWRFSRYSVGDSQRFARTLRALCFVHMLARLAACRKGVRGLGYADSLIVMKGAELRRRLKRYTELEEETVRALIRDLTYGERGLRFPDIALQPLVRLRPDTYAVAPSVVIGSSMERNWAVLMNRIPEERAIYNSLSEEREELTRCGILHALASLRFRQWHGDVPGWEEDREIDLALMEDATKCCVIMELKSFVAPAEAREIWERSKEIDKGTNQIKRRRARMQTAAEALHEALSIDKSWTVTWTVASESSVGGVFAQDAEVPVVRVGHLVRKILRNGGLKGVDQWLAKRLYLPREGVDYEVVAAEPEIDGWTLEWYGIKTMVDERLF